MSLNLNDFVADDTEITGLNGDKYILTARISREQYDVFNACSMDAAALSGEKIEGGRMKGIILKARTVAIDLLSIKNDRGLVKKFIDELPDNLFVKIFQHIGEHLMKQPEKKN